MNYLDILRVELRHDEGDRDKPYADTKGKITIGIGRNLSDVGINEGEKALLFANDLVEAERAARALVPNFYLLSDARKAAVMNMAFCMGEGVMAGFHNTIPAIIEGRWEDAARGILSSLWAKTPGDREERVAETIRTNTWKEPA